MRALVATGRADALIELREVAQPTPADHHAVVAVEAVSLNRGECRRLTTADEGWVPGWDVAGRVVAPAADGSGPAEGTRVVALVAQGAWAEQIVVDTSRVAVLPETLGAPVAATLPVAGMTALLALERGGSLLGRRIAVTGATGGVGGFALQLAALAGAHTTAVVSAPDRVGGLPAQGVDDVEVGLDGDGEPFDLILESVGGPLLAAALARIAPGGQVVTYGGSSAEPTTFEVTGFYPRHGASLSGFLLFSALDQDPRAGRHLERLTGLVADGRLDARVDVQRPWTEAARTIRALLDREITGKAVLTLT